MQEQVDNTDCLSRDNPHVAERWGSEMEKICGKFDFLKRTLFKRRGLTVGGRRSASLCQYVSAANKVQPALFHALTGNPRDEHGENETDCRIDRMAAAQFCRIFHWRSCFGARGRFLPTIGPDFLGTHFVGVRSGMVGTLCTDGYRCMAGDGGWRRPRRGLALFYAPLS